MMHAATAIRTGFLAVAVVLALAVVNGGATAQSREQSLADIRQELTVLDGMIKRLKRELSTSGGASVNVPSSGDALSRMDSMEAELRRLTGQVEALSFRVEQIVADGTRRIADLEFRLVELEGGDVSNLGETSTLGGETGQSPVVVTPPATNTGNGDLAVGEQSDFDMAMKAYEAGDFEVAAEAFDTFTNTYPGGLLTSRAHYFRGESLTELSIWNRAARAYLNAFSGDPQGELAPDALYRLGLSLDRIGQRDEACLTLREVSVRFPDDDVAGKADAEVTRLQCR